MKKNNYEKLKYFLECYFVSSIDFNEILELANEFKKSESTETIVKLTVELRGIKDNGNWREIQEFVLLCGMRDYDLNKTKELVEQLLQGLE